MSDDRLAGDIKSALAARRPAPSRQLADRLESVAQGPVRPRLLAPAVLALAVAAGALLVLATRPREPTESSESSILSSVGGGGSEALPAGPAPAPTAAAAPTAAPAPRAAPSPTAAAAPTAAPAPIATPAPTAAPAPAPIAAPALTPPPSLAPAQVDTRDPLAGYQALLDGTSPVAITPAQGAQLRKLATDLAGQRTYLAERKRDAEAELTRALAAVPSSDSRVLAAYDRIAAQDAALGRAQLAARLGARAVLDPQQRGTIERATPTPRSLFDPARSTPAPRSLFDHPTPTPRAAIEQVMPTPRAAIEHAAPTPRAARPSVTVRSSIAGTVYIDGRRVGDTPLATTVAAGSHQLRLDAPGYEPETTRFSVGESGEVAFDLEPHRRGQPAPSASASAFADAHAPATGGGGRLTLTTRPPTTIYVDDAPVGATPIDITLTPGRHAIRMVGKDLRTRKTMTFDVTAGQQSNLSFSFDD
ncbi:MAG TPA: PEGA domain-containing protein [Kofleriaceae bacterium]